MTDFGTYVCAQCGGTFEKTLSDEDAWEADKATFGDALTPDSAVIVCEDCYQLIMSPPKPSVERGFEWWTCGTQGRLV